MAPMKLFQASPRHWKKKNREIMTMTPIRRASPRLQRPSPAAVDGSVVARPRMSPALHLRPIVVVLQAQMSQPTGRKLHGQSVFKILGHMLAKEVWRLVTAPACERRKWLIRKTISIVGLRGLLAGQRGRKGNGASVMRSTWG